MKQLAIAYMEHEESNYLFDVELIEKEEDKKRFEGGHGGHRLLYFDIAERDEEIILVDLLSVIEKLDLKKLIHKQ